MRKFRAAIEFTMRIVILNNIVCPPQSCNSVTWSASQFCSITTPLRCLIEQSQEFKLQTEQNKYLDPIFEKQWLILKQNLKEKKSQLNRVLDRK
jgi:hypothetical protein